MTEVMKEFSDIWNEIIVDFPITLENLQKPDPVFFIRAIFKLFERLEIDIDSFIVSPPPYVEDGEFSNQPLVQLVEVVNFLLNKISPNYKVLSLIDIISPSPSTVQIVLRLLVNFFIFVDCKRQEVIVKEEEVSATVMKVEDKNIEMEKYKNNLVSKLEEMMQRKERVEQMKKDIVILEEQNVEPEKAVNELKSEYDFLREKVETFQAEYTIEMSKHPVLLDKIMKIKACILTENEQAEIKKKHESANQSVKEIDDKIEEIKSMLWKKEKDIKTFKENTKKLTECEALLNDLEALYEKIKSVEKSNENSYDEEKELRQMRDKVMEKEDELNQIKLKNVQLQEEHKKLTMQLDEEEAQYTMLENNCKEETNKMNDNIIKNKEEIENIKTLTLEYDRERQKLVYSQEEVFNKYNKIIKDTVNRIDRITEKVEKAELKYKIYDE